MRDTDPIDEFSRALDLLKIEYEKYFNGALAIPPEQMRADLQARLRRLQSKRLTTAVQRFRLNGIESRFNILGELFNRRMREYEMTGGSGSTAETSAPKTARLDPYSGIDLGDGSAKEPVEALYQELYSRAGGRENKTDFDSFHRLLRKQVAAIQKKTGCSQVRFRLSSDNGKLKLKAKPVKASGE